MPMPDNWFKEHSPADIVSKVGEITLAVISEWSDEELRRIGWLDNLIIDRLFSMTSAGVWNYRVSSSGEYSIVIDGRVSDIMSGVATQEVASRQLNNEGYTTVNSMSAIAGILLKRAHATGTVAGGSGAIAATDLVAAVASKKISCDMIQFTLSASGDHEGGTITVKDGDGTTLAVGIISSQKPELTLRFVDPTSAVNKKITFELANAGGLAALTDGDILIATAHYREH